MYDYGACLREMVRPGLDALVFHDAPALVAILTGLFEGFPGSTPALDGIRAASRAASTSSWDDGWGAEAWPIIRG